MITKNKLGQIFEMLTPAQVYLMDKTFICFNNKGLTTSPIVSLSTPSFNQFLSSQYPSLFLVLLSYFEGHLIEVHYLRIVISPSLSHKDLNLYEHVHVSSYRVPWSCHLCTHVHKKVDEKIDGQNRFIRIMILGKRFATSIRVLNVLVYNKMISYYI